MNNGLRKFCRRLELEFEVTQRLKKTATIEAKLTDYESKLDLSRMQDIGGCRVVLPDIASVRILEHQIQDTWAHRICRTYDYIETPRSSGYRSLHLIVEWDERMIEVQTRTTSMHTWAETVEAFNSALGENFKHDGDHVVQRYLRVHADILHAREVGVDPSHDLLDSFNKLVLGVREYLVSRVQRG